MLKKDSISYKVRNLLAEFMASPTDQTDCPQQKLLRGPGAASAAPQTLKMQTASIP